MLTEQATERLLNYNLVDNPHINGTLLHHHDNQSNKLNFS